MGLMHPQGSDSALLFLLRSQSVPVLIPFSVTFAPNDCWATVILVPPGTPLLTGCVMPLFASVGEARALQMDWGSAAREMAHLGSLDVRKEALGRSSLSIGKDLIYSGHWLPQLRCVRMLGRSQRSCSILCPTQNTAGSSDHLHSASTLAAPASCNSMFCFKRTHMYPMYCLA